MEPTAWWCIKPTNNLKKLAAEGLFRHPKSRFRAFKAVQWSLISGAVIRDIIDYSAVSDCESFCFIQVQVMRLRWNSRQIERQCATILIRELLG